MASTIFASGARTSMDCTKVLNAVNSLDRPVATTALAAESGLIIRFGKIWRVSAITSEFHLHLESDGSVSYTGHRGMFPAAEGYQYSSKGTQQIFDGQALGAPAWGTLRFLPQVPMNAGEPISTGWDFTGIDDSTLPDFAF